MTVLRFPAVLLLAAVFPAEPADTVKVSSRRLDRRIELPGEFLPFQQVALRAKISGFVEQVHVDRGSQVRKDQLLVTLVAPELTARRLEAEAKVQAADARRAEAQARLLAAESTYSRLKAASATPGVVAGNDLVAAGKAVEAERAQVQAAEGSAKAARAAVEALRKIEDYLAVTAPFDGIITQRNVHPGALAGPGSEPLLHLEQISRLRLVVAVPEVEVAGIARGARVSFTVPAWPGTSFAGVIARVARSMDARTRSMAVELDVPNADGRLAPGMFPTVLWPVRKPRPSLLVPASSIVSTTERTFVIRVRDGAAEWVNVTRGAPAGGLVEVFGPLAEGDVILRRASDEIREGTKLP
jgi:RND family efflux transporter MFP subunit